MRTFQTEDGYKFFEQPDGKLTDTEDPDNADLTYNNLDELKAAVTVIELPQAPSNE